MDVPKRRVIFLLSWTGAETVTGVVAEVKFKFSAGGAEGVSGA